MWVTVTITIIRQWSLFGWMLVLHSKTVHNRLVYSRPKRTIKKKKKLFFNTTANDCVINSNWNGTFFIFLFFPFASLFFSFQISFSFSLFIHRLTNSNCHISKPIQIHSRHTITFAIHNRKLFMKIFSSSRSITTIRHTSLCAFFFVFKSTNCFFFFAIHYLSLYIALWFVVVVCWIH